LPIVAWDLGVAVGHGLGVLLSEISDVSLRSASTPRNPTVGLPLACAEARLLRSAPRLCSGSDDALLPPDYVRLRRASHRGDAEKLQPLAQPEQRRAHPPSPTSVKYATKFPE
jgi:hypothetical protein